MAMHPDVISIPEKTDNAKLDHGTPGNCPTLRTGYPRCIRQLAAVRQPHAATTEGFPKAMTTFGADVLVREQEPQARPKQLLPLRVLEKIERVCDQLLWRA